MRRGTFHADEVVVVSNGAAWIGNTARTVFAGQKVTFIRDLHHVLEKLAAALKDLFPDGAKRDAAWKRPESMIRDGKAPAVVDAGCQRDNGHSLPPEKQPCR